MAKNTDVAEPALRNVELNWMNAQELPLVLADQVHIQAVPGRYYITFGQVNLPVFVGAPPSDFRADVRPVVRLVISTEDFKRILSAVDGVVKQATLEAAR